MTSFFLCFALRHCEEERRSNLDNQLVAWIASLRSQ
jgi:hypothetical protein